MAANTPHDSAPAWLQLGRASPKTAQRRAATARLLNLMIFSSYFFIHNNTFAKKLHVKKVVIIMGVPGCARHPQETAQD
jgi:hypothetical protein